MTQKIHFAFRSKYSHGRNTAFPKYRLALIALLAFWFATPHAFSQQGVRNSLYTIPNSTFYQQPSSESVVTINDTSGSIASLQPLIDAARLSQPTKIILICLKAGANYPVTNTPLTLGSRMCLKGGGATLEASLSNFTSTALIRIAPGASYASVNDVILVGNSTDTYGVEAAGVSRVNLDAITVTGTGRDGIFVQGLGSSVFDNEITVTRCDVSGVSNQSGIRLADTTQAICIENQCDNNRIGILIGTSSRAAVANNQCRNNAVVGIAIPDSTWNRVSNNSCSGCPTGISLGSASERNMLVSNDLQNATRGIDLGGNGQTIYDNKFSNGVTSPLVVSGTNTNHNIISTSAPLSASNQRYFYPPTKPNDHSEAIMNGRSRIEINTSATSISQIQGLYDASRAANPDAVTVLRLNATQITGDATLVLASNTCVIINGTITLNSGVAAMTGLNLDYVSISGGTIDGANTTGRNGLAFDGCSRVLLDHITLKNFGAKATRVGGSDIIAFNAGGTPCIVGYCSVDGGAARGIWTKGGSASFIITDNFASNVNMDGIDIDAFTGGSIVKFNTANGSVRTGIFVEEAAKHNQVFGNVCNTNAMGINIQSTAVGPTSYNTFFSNSINYGTNRGIRTGAVSTLSTEHNFCFNNAITNTNGAGIDSQGAGTENYWSQNYLSTNSVSIDTISSAVFFNSPSVAINTVPAIGSISDQSVDEDNATLAIPFTISDSETATSALTLTKNSSNSTLVPVANVVLGGSSSNRTVTVTPAANQYGSALITISVSDGLLAASESFTVTVAPVNDPPAIATLSDQITDEDTTTSLITLNISDIDTPAESLTLSAVSSNTSLVPNANLVLSGSGGARSLTITPSANQNGSSSITITISDGRLTASKTFVVTFRPVEDYPIANLGSALCYTNQSIDFDLRTVASDPETSSAALRFSITSATNGNASLLSDGHTVRFTPFQNHVGNATFTYNVSDRAMDPRLLANYDFQAPDVATDGIATDVSGGGRDGTLTAFGNGTFTYVTDTPSSLSAYLTQSLSLFQSSSGGSARLQRTFTSSDLNFQTGNWTVSGWCKRTSTADQDVVFHLGANNLTSSTKDFALSFPAGNTTLSLSNWSTSNDVTIGTPLTTGAWHHFSVVRNGGTLNLYTEGNRVASDSSFSLTFDSTSPIFFGSIPSTSNTYWYKSFNGSFADLAVFNAPLTDQEVARLSTAPAALIGNLASSNSVNLSVSKQPASISLGSLSPTYDGTSKSASATTTPSGLTVNFTYNGSATIPAAAGTYAVVGTIHDANYAGTASGSLVIAKAVASIELGNLTATYNGTAKSPSYGTLPENLPATLTLNGTSAMPVNAGSYPITGTIVASNYSGNTTAIMVIAKANADVTLSNLDQVSDGSQKSATVTTSPLGLVVLTTYNGSASLPIHAGTYDVISTIQDPNYQGTSNRTLVIRKGTRTFNSWLIQNFTASEILNDLSASTADPDQDGLSNLCEYALGSDPHQAGPAPTVSRGQNSISLTFSRPANTDDVSYRAETSNDLMNWSAVTLEVLGTQGDIETIRATCTLSSPAPKSQYMRLRFAH
ncbi:MAG: MBG domain-containing protein [Akkermansiaceae bacterium]|nr:MBG domain-containing protein [Akkermansiaceae bacterium]